MKAPPVSELSWQETCHCVDHVEDPTTKHGKEKCGGRNEDREHECVLGHRLPRVAANN
jgi:hypothetical protein